MRLLFFLVALLPAAGWPACNVVGGQAFGDCANVNVQTGAKSPLHVRAWVNESGILASATVYPGGQLHMSGIVEGDIVVKRGGRLVVTGIVSGTIKNEGGVVEIEGIVSTLRSDGGSVLVGGQLDIFAGVGPVDFKTGAVFQGKPLAHATRMPKTRDAKK